ncbi:MAG: hypothetical protein P8K68_13220 [Algibacter sp.]|uniref:hypothetical protein n=1 Tax=Algibacter sp. TaxID=1872428 RepID=UPI002615E158|nr:hypothetical protein [Algibacter sp.]MDG1730505.1 hypothetical protein [Algibacter sp.]MDG2179727.1 hypothetical protein [Algibacter sp.]
MSAKIIILIIGVLFILIALLASKKSSSGKLVIPLGILGVLMMIYGSYSSDFVNYNTQIEQVSTGNKLKISGPVNSVKVVSPVDKDSVDCRILTMGVYPESNENDIWVLIRPTDDRYYPQSDHTNTSYKRDGEWQVVTRFGGDKGEAYDLIIYEANSEASSFFSNTIAKWKEEENYPGLQLEEIPTGAKEVDRIKIYARKNCRGVF